MVRLMLRPPAPKGEPVEKPSLFVYYNHFLVPIFKTIFYDYSGHQITVFL